jgi:hypothetical protein
MDSDTGPTVVKTVSDSDSEQERPGMDFCQCLDDSDGGREY